MPEDNKFDAPELSQEVKAELQELAMSDPKLDDGFDAAIAKVEAADKDEAEAEEERKPLGRLYECHKRVHAAQITKVRAPRGDTVNLELNLGFNDVPFTEFVSREWADKHKPQAGGYLITYDDGYVSYSPQFAFENGYHIAEGGEG